MFLLPLFFPATKKKSARPGFWWWFWGNIIPIIPRIHERYIIIVVSTQKVQRFVNPKTSRKMQAISWEKKNMLKKRWFQNFCPSFGGAFKRIAFFLQCYSVHVLGREFWFIRCLKPPKKKAQTCIKNRRSHLGSRQFLTWLAISKPSSGSPPRSSPVGSRNSYENSQPYELCAWSVWRKLWLGCLLLVGTGRIFPASLAVGNFLEVDEVSYESWMLKKRIILEAILLYHDLLVRRLRMFDRI